MAKIKSDSYRKISQIVTTMSEVRALAGEFFSTQKPFGHKAEGLSYCSVEGYVIYGGVLKYQLDKLPFYFRFRTFEDGRGLVAFYIIELVLERWVYSLDQHWELYPKPIAAD